MPVVVNSLDKFDFIIVGGGTAGCAVAGRLAEAQDVSVLVIEAGKSNPGDIAEIVTPARAFELRGSDYDWAYKATMIDVPEYTRIEKPTTRGKVLGGSSCVNYYTWLRGSKATFDDWAEFGGEEWNWEHTQEYFDKPATYHDDEKRYSPKLQHIGTNGPIHVSHSQLLPETAAFRNALKQAWASEGEQLTEDVFGGIQAENVYTLPETRCKKLVISDGRVTGVEVLDRDGQTHRLSARKEVILSAGVYESPKLLLLSGIGPREHLQAVGIDTVVDSVHVGRNLLDHPILSHVFKLRDGYGLDNHLLRAGPERSGAVSAYRKDRTGPFSSGLLELVGFPRIDERLKQSKEYRAYMKNNGNKDPFGPGGQPHFQIDFIPMFSDAFQWHFPTPRQGDYFTVIVDLLRPLSQSGSVKLRSSDPLDDPAIDENFFSDELDIVALREGVRFVDDIIMHGEGMKDLIENDWPWPMPRTSDEAMKQQILERMQTGFHPCGTVRLGKAIEQGAVDSQLRVHGVDGLRVVDASIMPVIPDCRIQNAVYMIGEKGADMIKATHADLYNNVDTGSISLDAVKTAPK